MTTKMVGLAASWKKTYYYDMDIRDTRDGTAGGMKSGRRPRPSPNKYVPLVPGKSWSVLTEGGSLFIVSKVDAELARRLLRGR